MPSATWNSALLAGAAALVVACGESEPPPEAVEPAVEVQSVPAAPVRDVGISDVLTTNRLTIETCYRNALREKPEVRGRIEFEWLIESNKVTASQVVSTNFPEDYDIMPLSNCILEGSKNWRFPDGDGAVRYPITFEPQT